MSTVYLIQETTKSLDLSSANRYGKLETIFASNESPSITPGAGLVKAEKYARLIDPVKDYLLWIGGDPMSLFLMGVALQRQKNIFTFQWLRWERERDTEGNRLRTGFYCPVKMMLRQPPTTPPGGVLI